MDLLLQIVIFIFGFLFLLLLGKPKPVSNLPPGPRQWPLVGNLFHLFVLLRGERIEENKVHRGQPPLHQVLASLSKIHGPLIHLRLGTQPLIVVSSSIAATEVLKTHDKIFSTRYIPSAYRVSFYTCHSLAWSTSCDDQWKTQRSVCRRQLFSPKPLESGAAGRERKAMEMMENVSRGEEVRVADLVFRTVFDMLGNVVFSQDVIDLYAWDMKKDMDRGLEIGSLPNLEDFFGRLFGMFDPQGLRKETANLVMRSYSLWDQIVKERKQREGGRKDDDLLELLLSSGFEGFKLNALIMDIFTAGTDTTTHSIEWTMAELTKNPHVMQKLKVELQQALQQKESESNELIKESDVVHLSYLQACIKESLRLHPPTPLLLPHLASATCHNILGRYTIPEGSVVVVNVWALGRDPADWVDPLVYSPERFLTRKEEDRGAELMAFGAGRRMCPGSMLANRITALIVASLVHKFDWTLPGGMNVEEVSMEEKPGLLLERKEPLVLVPTTTANCQGQNLS